MPIMQTIFISGSVGQGGTNAPADVMAVQRQLNGQMNAPRQKLTVDGRCGPKTIAMITDFQSVVAGIRTRDGRVDPGGKTLAALNSPASEGKWAGMSMAPGGGGGYTPAPAAPVYGGGGGGGQMPSIPANIYTAQEISVLQALYAKIAEVHSRKPASDVLDDMIKNEVQAAKALLAVQGVAQYGGELLEGMANMSRAGFSAREIGMVLADGAKRGGGGIDKVIQGMRLVGQNARLAATLKGLGKVAFVVTVIITAFECADHFRAGRLGQGMAEAYGGFMSVAIPWAGAVNALQGLLFTYQPNMQNDPKINMAFKVLNSIDPIGAGKVAVDTMYTMLKLFGTSIWNGSLDMKQVNDLADRMRNSPLRFWTEVGDSMGDWMGDQFGDWMYQTFLK